MRHCSWFPAPAHLLLSASLLTAATLSTGCSLLYDLNANQCTSSEGCATGLTCQAGICVDSGAGTAGTENPIDTPCGDACCSNRECMDQNSGLPFACIEGECVDVRGPTQCLALDTSTYERLGSDDPIILGAFTAMPALNPSRHQVTVTYQMALDLFHTATGGVPTSGGQPRPVVVVACDVQNADTIDDSLAHLTQTLKVPGLIAPMPAEDLQSAFQTYGQPNGIFFLSPYEADQFLTALPDDGLLWHMLGSTDAVGQVYLPLLERAKARVLATFDPAPAEEDLRVAWVQNDQRFMLQLSAAVRDTVAVDLGSNFTLQNINTDPAGATAVDYTSQIQSIIDFRPHIVVAMAGSEFVTDASGGFMQGLEANWSVPGDGQPPPFYLLSPWHSGNADLYNYLLGVDASVADRIAGVNHATAVDSTNLTNYLVRFRSEWGDTNDAEGFENFYDSIWYMLLAATVAGSFNADISGSDLVAGMRLLVNRNGPRHDLVEGQFGNIVSALRTTVEGIALYGTMGEPNFNPNSGVRLTPGSVYCVEPNGDFFHDVLRFDETSELLTGDFSCIEGF